MKPDAGDSLGRYTIQELIAHGGMAVVYRATDPLLRREVAIKVPHDFLAADPAFRDRFAREAATVARLRHPNVVTVFDYGEEQGTPYIVTEYVPGGTLAERLGQPIAVADALAVLQPLAAALDYAHGQGILHRDVKPSNIMFQRDQTPVLSDFGLARIAGSLPPLTRTGETLGTAEYMAPETAGGDVATPSVDRYGLAVIAFEMLTGRVPFAADNKLAILIAHRDKPPPRPRSLNPALTPDIEEVLLRALEKDPEDRYASAVEFANALAAAASVPPAPARVESRPAEAGGRDSLLEPRPAGAARSYEISVTGEGFGSDFGGEQDAGRARRLALAEAVQRPAALLPLAASALGLIYVLLLAPSAMPAISAGLAAALMAGIGVRAAVRSYPEEYAEVEERLQKLRDQQRREREQQELSRLHQTLREGFAAIESSDGIKTLARLTGEFQELQPALDRRRESDPLSMALVPALSVETYRRGLSVLVDALDLANAASVSGMRRLREESGELEREVEALKRDPANEERLRMRQESLEDHRDRLRRLEALQLNREQLLYAAQRCEASLHRTRIDLAAIRTGTSESSVDGVIEALRRTIDQARAVQDEIRRLGY